MTMLGPCPQPLKIPLYYQKLLQPCRGGCQDWRNCATRCATAHSRSGSDESKREGATLRMHVPIGSQPAISWASPKISYYSWSRILLPEPVGFTAKRSKMCAWKCAPTIG